MGTKKAKAKPTAKKGAAKPAYSGHCATISDMVSESVIDGENVTIVAEDGDGFYLTTEAWLDRKFADPNRTSTKRYESVDDAIAAA